MSDTVARTGCPLLPNTSQKTTGLAPNAGMSTPMFFSRSASFGDGGARSRDAGEVAFDVRHERRHADARQLLGHDLQRDGLPGSSRASDEPVTIRERGQQAQFAAARHFGNGKGLCHAPDYR